MSKENAATRALEIVLRREWNKTFDVDAPYARKFAQQRVKNMIRTVPKTSARVAAVVKNVSANESTIAALKRAVDAGDVGAIKKLYRPEFFFEVLQHGRAANANVMNAVLRTTMRRTSPETLLRRLLGVDAETFPAMPSAVARIAMPVEKIVRTAVDVRAASSGDLLSIFKTIEKKSAKKLDFSRVRGSDMFLLLADRHDEYIDSVENSPPMDILILLQFMIKRGAPRVPLEDVMRYVIDYETEIGGNRENRPEFDALLRLYDD